MPSPTPTTPLAVLSVAGLLAVTLLAPPAGAEDAADTPDDAETAEPDSPDELTPSLTDSLLGSLADRDPDRAGSLLAGLGLDGMGDFGQFDDHDGFELASLEELSAELRSERAELLSGAGPDDFGETFAQFRESGTLDGQLAGAAADFAGADLLSSPTLELPDLDVAGFDGGERAAFGTFYVNTVSSLIDEHPDLVDDLDGSALGSASGRDQLRDAMQEGSERTLGDFNDMMPAPEVAGMLHALGSGDGDAARELAGDDRDDGGCVTAGLYLREEMFDRLSSPSASPDVGSDDRDSGGLGGLGTSGTAGGGETPDLPGWVGDATGDSPPADDGNDRSPAPSLPSPGADASLEDCGDASTLRDSVLDVTVPSVTGRLEGLLER